MLLVQTRDMARFPYVPNFPDDSMDPFRKMREDAERLSKLYQQQLKPFNALPEQIAAIKRNPFAEMAEERARLLETLYGQSKSIASEITKATRLGTLIDQHLLSIVRPPVVDQAFRLLGRVGFDEHVTSRVLGGKLFDSSLRTQIDSIFGAVRQPLIERQLQAMFGNVRSAGLARFDAATATLTIGGVEFPVSDFEDPLRAAADEADSAPLPQQLRVFLQAVLAHAARLKGKKGVAFTLLVIMWLGRTMLEGQIEAISGELVRPVTERIIRRLKPEVRERVVAVVNENPSTDVRKIRMVTAVNLHVRSAPRHTNSHIVSRVSTPAIVLVLKVRKDWSLIQFRDGEATVRGWAFSRYLKRVDV